MDLPERKQNRLKNYDYSSCGAYFITICTKDKRNLFWNSVGAAIGRPEFGKHRLSPYGIIAEKALENIENHYPAVAVDKYVVMPNHVHIILTIKADVNGRPMGAPTISTVINQYKGYVTKQIGFQVWQKLFHDHVIRNQQDYDEIWRYIDENPLRWESDCYY